MACQKVKIMRPSALDSTQVKFLQEAAIMGQFFHSNVVKLHGVVTVGEPVSYKNIVCSYFVASVSYRKLDIGLGMRLVNLCHAQAMIVLELMPFGDLAAYLKKNHK